MSVSDEPADERDRASRPHVRLAAIFLQECGAEKPALRIVSVNPDQPREDRLAMAVGALATGSLIAIPTETFYGLAVDSANPDALRRVNRIKRKVETSPLLLLLGRRDQASRVATGLPPEFDALAEMFWPGPLTLVVSASHELDPAVSGGRGTVAVRVPGLSLPRKLAQGLGRPITGVSANLEGRPPCRTAAEVARAFPEGLDWILDGGPTTGGAPSTIVDLSRSPPRLLRPGLVPESSVRSFLPELQGPAKS